MNCVQRPSKFILIDFQLQRGIWSVMGSSNFADWYRRPGWTRGLGWRHIVRLNETWKPVDNAIERRVVPHGSLPQRRAATLQRLFLSGDDKSVAGAQLRLIESSDYDDGQENEKASMVVYIIPTWSNVSAGAVAVNR